MVVRTLLRLREDEHLWRLNYRVNSPGLVLGTRAELGEEGAGERSQRQHHRVLPPGTEAGIGPSLMAEVTSSRILLFTWPSTSQFPTHWEPPRLPPSSQTTITYFLPVFHPNANSCQFCMGDKALSLKSLTSQMAGLSTYFKAFLSSNVLRQISSSHFYPG